jgi:hypothetical protein
MTMLAGCVTIVRIAMVVNAVSTLRVPEFPKARKVACRMMIRTGVKMPSTFAANGKCVSLKAGSGRRHPHSI